MTIPTQPEQAFTPHQQILERLAIPWSRLDPRDPGAALPGVVSPLLMYMHIPKTGGQTLQSVLGINYRPAEIFHVPADRDDYAEVFAGMPAPVRSRIRVVIGHLKLQSKLYGLLSSPFYHFTMLRDPVSRIRSHYHFIMANEWHPRREILLREKATLLDFVTRQDLYTGQNFAVQYLSGSDAVDEFSLERARLNLLNHFTFFGLADRYDELLVMMKDILGLNDIFYTRQNVGIPREEQSDSVTEEAIRHHARFDQALYQAAREEYEQRITQLGQAFGEKTRQFRQYNRLVSLVREEALASLRQDRDVIGVHTHPVSSISPEKDSEKSISAVFIGGTGRSGTSPLAHALRNLPGALYFSEPRFLVDRGGVKDIYSGAVSLAEFSTQMLGLFREKLVHALRYSFVDNSAEVYSKDHVSLLLTKHFPDETASRPRIKAFLHDLFALGLDAWQRSFVLEKTPHTVLIADLLLEIFPEMYYIHMIRDPRDVCCSTLEQNWGPNDIDSFIVYYQRIMAQALKAREQFPAGRYRVLSLERLMTEPFRSIEFLTRTTGLQASDEQVREWAGQLDPDRAHIGRWQEQLDPETAAKVEASCAAIFQIWKEIEDREFTS